MLGAAIRVYAKLFARLEPAVLMTPKHAQAKPIVKFTTRAKVYTLPKLQKLKRLVTEPICQNVWVPVQRQRAVLHRISQKFATLQVLALFANSIRHAKFCTVLN